MVKIGEISKSVRGAQTLLEATVERLKTSTVAASSVKMERLGGLGDRF